MRLSHLQAEIGSLELSAVFEMGKTKVIAAVYGPCEIIRKQFPLPVSFAMTINKSQGQSLSKVGLYLLHPVFTHGQLYVVVSRVKSKRGLKVVVCDEDDSQTKYFLKMVEQGLDQLITGQNGLLFGTGRIRLTRNTLTPLLTAPVTLDTVGAFQKLPMVMPSVDILHSALRKARRVTPTKGIANAAKREKNKGAKHLDALMKELTLPLRTYKENFPNKRHLHPYERSLILTLGVGNYEEVLGRVDSLRKKVGSVGKELASLCAQSTSKREAEEGLAEVRN
ncbi:nucleolar GTP-binding protein 1 [Tanacetum coccineum]